MSSIVLAAPYVLRVLTSIYAFLCSYFCSMSSFPPEAPSLLGGYDNGLLYVLSPCLFLLVYRKCYGSLYRVSLGSWRLLVVSSGDAISSIFPTSSQLLSRDTLHHRMLHVIAGVQTGHTRLHDVVIRDIYPLLDRSLSLHSLGETTRSFGPVLLSQIRDLTLNHGGPISLTQLTHEPLFNATNLVLFGSIFSRDAYSDFRILDKSIPDRFCGISLWNRRSLAARTRLLKLLGDYSRREEYDTTPFAHDFLKILGDNKIQSLEEAQLLLVFLWTVHSNILNNAFFSLSFLLGDPDGFARVRAEVDLAVQRFGGLEELLRADPGELDDPSLQLLTSTIMETLRFTGLHAGVSQATRDFNLPLNDMAGTTVPIKKGEYVFGDVRAAHMDPSVFPDPESFVVDRFARRPYERKHLQTEGRPFYSFGGGKNLCKGRWLALYEIRVLLIVLLHTFDFTPAVSMGWSRPRVHPRSIGVVHTDDDLLAWLSFRRVDDAL